MYQEASLMYGYDFSGEDVVLSPLLTKVFDDKVPEWNSGELGFTAPYSGYDNNPRGFGVFCGYWDETGDEEDEDYIGRDDVDFGESSPDFGIMGYTTEAQKQAVKERALKEYAELWEKLPQELKAELEAQGKPYFFTLWSTS
jgi:hypothetical protein